MSSKVANELGQRLITNFKVASDLLENAQIELHTASDKLAAVQADEAAASPLADEAITKLASIRIYNSPLVDEADLPAFKQAAQSRQGLATMLRDVVNELSKSAADLDKTAATSELGSASSQADPYQVGAGNSSRSATGYASLPRRSFL